MKMSAQGLQLLASWEGCKTNVYKDAAGLPTIGVGHLLLKSENASGHITIAGSPVRFGSGLSESQVQDLLAQDLERYEDAVNEKVTVALDQNQFDALVAFSFNVGIGAFQKSSLLTALNQGNFADVPDELRRWATVNGKQIQGLVNRRQKEIKLWLGEI